MNRAMDRIEWEDPPTPSDGRGRPGYYVELFDALRQAPGRWAKWPTPTPTKNSAAHVALRVRRGQYVGQGSPGEFDAVSVDLGVWVRAR